ncbi:MAG: hypothetical protein J6Y78_04335 [Paludibacteraceae bacterium]|nr:hypothetical protein [Paludibacteraceae bacterium]
MKFKYTGEDDCFCIELLAYKLVEKGSYLKKGQVINVPNDLTNVISSLEVSGIFDKVQDKKVNKKEDKE